MGLDTDSFVSKLIPRLNCQLAEIMGRLATADWSVTAGSGLTGYLWQIQRFPMLKPHEEDTLAKRWREHGDHEAAHKLVNSHLRLVAKIRSEEHTSELQSLRHLVCRLLLEKK